MATSVRSIHQQTGVHIDVEEFEQILDAQRTRFVARFAEFDAERWRQPTRCSEWDAHTVMRHLADCAETQLSAFTGTPAPFVNPAQSFDPQVTPDQWLAHSAEEAPGATVERYDVAMQAVTEHAIVDYSAGIDRTTSGPYGRAHWSTVIVHILWDAWLHERDILLASDAADQVAAPDTISGDANERRLIALYSTLMATVPGAKLGQPLRGTIELGAEVPVRAQFSGDADELSVSEIDSGEAMDLRGELLAVVDATGGRGQPLAEVLTGPKAIVDSFALLGSFI